MAFGKALTKKELDRIESVASGGGSSSDVWYLKQGGTTVRFLGEPDDGSWCGFKEVYDKESKKSWPVAAERWQDDPHYDPDLKPSRRYLAPAVIIEDGSGQSHDRVYAVQLPGTLFDLLLMRYRKYGTLTDRDYELIRTGEKLDTRYTLDPCDKMQRNVSKYGDLPDMQAILQAAYEAVWGEAPDEDGEAPRQRRQAVPKAPARSQRVVEEPEDEDDEIEDDEDEDEDELPKPRSRRRVEPVADEEDEEPEEDEDDEEDESADDGDEFWSEDELRELPIGALRSVAKEAGINTRGMTKDAIIEAMLES